jgi:hypothetical protein
MATTWIHRLHASDILVYFKSLREARQYTIQYMLKNINPSDISEEERNSIWFKDHFSDENGVYDVGATTNLQFAFMTEHRMPPLPALPPKISTWNTVGTVLLSPEDALALGPEDEPEGFIPGESEGLWIKETRSAEELDRELETYMQAAV